VKVGQDGCVGSLVEEKACFDGNTSRPCGLLLVVVCTSLVKTLFFASISRKWIVYCNILWYSDALL